jgi:hypothetical protein
MPPSVPAGTRLAASVPAARAGLGVPGEDARRDRAGGGTDQAAGPIRRRAGEAPAGGGAGRAASRSHAGPAVAIAVAAMCAIAVAAMCATDHNFGPRGPEPGLHEGGKGHPAGPDRRGHRNPPNLCATEHIGARFGANAG